MISRENENPRVVVVAGAQGVSGTAVLKQYAAMADTAIYGLSRRPSESSGNIHQISVDLMSPGEVKAKLGQLNAITHLFFGAYGIWRLCLPPGLRQRLKHHQGPAGRLPRVPR